MTRVVLIVAPLNRKPLNIGLLDRELIPGMGYGSRET